MSSTKLFGKSDICEYCYRSWVTEKTMKKYVKKMANSGTIHIYVILASLVIKIAEWN